ncbi:hypothetical protein INR49_018499 [Caranx melampygus]|nr:hypothetical protein INR49_018499 [Caranx melampygus]
MGKRAPSAAASPRCFGRDGQAVPRRHRVRQDLPDEEDAEGADDRGEPGHAQDLTHPHGERGVDDGGPQQQRPAAPPVQRQQAQVQAAEQSGQPEQQHRDQTLQPESGTAERSTTATQKSRSLASSSTSTEFWLEADLKEPKTSMSDVRAFLSMHMFLFG